MSLRSDITRLVESTPIADTHEHIMEEKLRLEPGNGSRLDDFAVLFSHYSDSDLAGRGDAAGRPRPRDDPRRALGGEVEAHQALLPGVAQYRLHAGGQAHGPEALWRG